MKNTVLLFTLLAITPNLLKADGPDGPALYTQTCAACHQATGAGVPNVYPALMGSAVVAGDSDTVIKVVLEGPAQVLPADRPKYSGQMPPFAGLSDANLAALLTYIRNKFGKGASAVTESEVTKVRATLPQ
jgi:mono/diheme cytochrome c family protein